MCYSDVYAHLLNNFNLIIGEFFTYSGYEYIVKTNGIYKKLADNNYKLDYELMSNMLVGNIIRVKIWNPYPGEIYYVPAVSADDLYHNLKWSNDDKDKKLLERNLVYKTKDEAIRIAKMMLDVTAL